MSLSEIRVNTTKTRTGVGTITYTETGPVITGIATASNFKTGSTNVHSTGVELSNINTGGSTANFGGAISGTSATLSGALSGTTATFSGTVSIGGTLTYEDVTNIDAVGIITAKAGIHIDDSITHIGDTNTKIRFPSNDTITFETNGDQALEITPGGGVKFNDADTPGSTTAPTQILNHAGGWQFYGSSDSGTHRNIIFGTNNASAGERLRIKSSGLVGINSTTPDAFLDIGAHTTSNPTLHVRNHTAAGSFSGNY